jgi:hypothetical protein
MIGLLFLRRSQKRRTRRKQRKSKRIRRRYELFLLNRSILVNKKGEREADPEEV